MDLTTFEKQALRLPVDISVFVRGNHGTGKSEIICNIAKKFKLPIMQRRLSQLTEGDLIGLPNKVENRYSEFLPMEWFVECMEKPHLIFLDEIDRALPEVIQAAFELCYDRCIQGKKIHDECRIYAAGNSGIRSSIYQVNTLDPAFLSRFWIADFQPTIQEWLNWGREVNIHEKILEFIEDDPDHLEMLPNEKLKPEYIYPSRRSWHRLHRTLKSEDYQILTECEKADLVALCTGFVGLNAASSFVKYLMIAKKRIKAEDVLDCFGERGIYFRVKSLTIEDGSVLINRLFQHSKQNEWTDKQIKNVIDFLFALPDELKMVLNDYMTRLDVHQENAKRYTQLSSTIMQEVVAKCSKDI